MESSYRRIMTAATYKEATSPRIIDDVEYNATAASYNATSISENTSRPQASSLTDMPVLDLGRPSKRKACDVSVQKMDRKQYMGPSKLEQMMPTHPPPTQTRTWT